MFLVPPHASCEANCKETSKASHIIPSGSSAIIVYVSRTFSTDVPNDEPFEYPLKLACKGMNRTYMLTGLVVRDPKYSDGHFYALIVDRGGKQWWKFNDARKDKIKLEQFVLNYKKHVLFLFYVLQQQSS